MKYIDFEKHIKNELHDSEESVQMDTLLASLNLGKQKPERKGFALWMILPFLLLIISFFAWKFVDSEDQIKTSANINQEFSSSIHPKSEVFEMKDKHLENNNVLSTMNDQNPVVSENSIEDIIVNASKNQTTESSLLNSLTKSQLPSKDANKTFINSKNQNIYSGHLNENSKISNLNPSYLNRPIPESAANKQEGKEFNAIEAPLLEIETSRMLSAVTDLNSSLTTLSDNDIDGNLFSRMKINCPSFDNSGWHLALIPEIGIFRPFKTLENNTLEESPAFNERIESESTLEGIEIGLYGMLVRDNVPLYLKAGVSYSRIAERMNLKYEYTERDTTIGIISSTISANGDTITHIYGDIVTETTFKGSNRQHHYIHLFDIPISIGYTTYLAGLDIGIEAGIKINFMTRATGQLLTSQNEYTNLSLNKLFKNTVGVNYFGGLMIGRNFGQFGDIYIAPRFTYFPNSFNNQNNNVNQNYFNVGINAGVVYRIN